VAGFEADDGGLRGGEGLLLGQRRDGGFDPGELFDAKGAIATGAAGRGLANFFETVGR